MSAPARKLPGRKSGGTKNEKLFHVENWLRWALDRFGTNIELASFYHLFAPPQAYRFCNEHCWNTYDKRLFESAAHPAE